MIRPLFLSVFSVLIFLNVSAQWGGMSGEGDVVRQEITLDKFTGVQLGFSGDVYLTQGSTQKVVIEAQQNIIDNIERQVKEGTWYINYDKSVRKCKPVKVYITIPDLERAGVSGSGNLVTESRFTGLGGVDTYISGSGDIKLDIEAQRVESAISGSGNITLKGSAESLDCAVSGSGNIGALKMEVRNCNVAISGSGDADVHATEELQVSIAGSGDVRYKGSSTRVKSRVSGSGDVTQID